MAYPASLLLALFLSQDTGGASAPEELPRIVDSLPCRGPGEEIVVCGRRPRTEQYRIPVELREEPLTARNYSWAARARDEREAARYDGQAIGPAGAFSRSRQVDCEWRAERMEIAGQMIDCSQRVRARTPE